MAEAIDRRFERLTGLICWGAYWDVDTGFRLNFGEPHLMVEGPLSPLAGRPLRPRHIYRIAYLEGDWVFWIGPSARWRAAFPDMEPTSGSSSYRRIIKTQARLDGQKLVSANVNPRNGSTRLVFDTATVLDIKRPGRDYNHQLWTLRSHEQEYLTVYGDAQYSLSDGTLASPPRQSI